MPPAECVCVCERERERMAEKAGTTRKIGKHDRREESTVVIEVVEKVMFI